MRTVTRSRSGTRKLSLPPPAHGQLKTGWRSCDVNSEWCKKQVPVNSWYLITWLCGLWAIKAQLISSSPTWAESSQTCLRPSGGMSVSSRKFSIRAKSSNTERLATFRVSQTRPHLAPTWLKQTTHMTCKQHLIVVQWTPTVRPVIDDISVKHSREMS